MWSAIVNGMTAIFSALHSFIVSLGIPENKEGLSYVLAIFIFTLIIRLLILPLNIKSTKSNAKMQEIQPELKKIQAKYANDPQKMQLETSKLMKENNVSMFGGCNTEDSPMNMATMNIVMAGMMGFMALQFQPILVIYWIIGGIIQLVQTYFINYLPAKKKAEEKAKLEAEKKVYAPKSKKKKK